LKTATELYIIDPQLGIEGGHFLPYAVSVSKAAMDHGKKVAWYTNRSFKSQDAPIGVKSWLTFDRRVFDEVQSEGDNWAINNFNTLNAEFYKILVQSIPTPDDKVIILFPNLLHTQLYAVIEWAKNYCNKSSVIVILRWNNALMDYNVSRNATDIIRSLYKFCLSNLSESNKNIVLASDTVRLAKFYSDLANLSVEYLPNPQVSESVNSYDDVRKLTNLDDGFVLSHIGGFSPLRGSHLLPELFEHVIQNHRGARIRCHVDDFSTPNFHKLLEVQRKYKSRITVLGNVIDDALYRDLFRTSDLLIMAYHPVFYHYGSSGVACEALSWGVPAVVPANTTIADEFAGVDAGFIACDEWTFEAYAMSLSAAINGIQALTDKSKKAKALYRSLVSPQTFLDRILA
jgi:glycosyltransferase involved in cell wall biosynthesis